MTKIYSFSNIKNGSYLVVFEYDTEKYELTKYLANNIDTTISSKVVSKKININGNEVTASVTDIINLQENVFNINIGLKENLPDTKIILLSLTSMGDKWGKKNQLAAFNNVKIKALAEKYNYSYIDIYTPLLNLETNEIYDEYTTDGGHLTPLGYQVITNKITPVIEDLLD